MRGSPLARSTGAGTAGAAATITGAGTADVIVISRTDATSSFSNALMFLYSPGWSWTHVPWKLALVHACHTPERTTADDAVVKPFLSRSSIGLCRVVVLPRKSLFWNSVISPASALALTTASAPASRRNDLLCLLAINDS